MTPNQHRVMVIDDSNTIRTISDSMLSELVVKNQFLRWGCKGKEL